MNFTISEVSKKMGLAASAIRYYEQEGLLPHVQRKPNGVRFYSADDIERISFINGLKKAGLTINEIRECFTFCDRGDETIDKRIRLFQMHKQSISLKISELEQCIEDIDDKIKFLQEKKKS